MSTVSTAVPADAHTGINGTALTVLIVLFLIANFSATGEVLMMTKDVQLPEASKVEEIQLAPVVMVSLNPERTGGGEVSINSKRLGTLEELMRDEGFLNIPALEEELRTMKKQYEDLHAMAQHDQRCADLLPGPRAEPVPADEDERRIGLSVHGSSLPPYR